MVFSTTSLIRAQSKFETNLNINMYFGIKLKFQKVLISLGLNHVYEQGFVEITCLGNIFMWSIKLWLLEHHPFRI